MSTERAKSAAQRHDQTVETISVGSSALTTAQLVAIARESARVRIDDAALSLIETGRSHVDKHAVSDQAVYGISTGFGGLADIKIPREDRARLQVSLVKSHAASTGPEVEAEILLAMMALRLHEIATGFTGVSLEVAHSLENLINARITPIAGEYGSLGCSGDLAPLAHIALALTGQGHVRDASGTPMPASQALDQAGLAPVEFAEKEGLSLINGTDGMLAMLSLACTDLARLVKAHDISAAMSIEALLGTDTAFEPDVMRLRPHPGQQASAANLIRLLRGSEVMASHREPHQCDRVQDAYSLRCTPQVAGAVRDTLAHAELVAAREMAAAIDNPAVLADGRIASHGNFHGAPLGYVLDFLAIAVADLASIAERRTDRMLDTARSHGLPPFLAAEPGIDSGYMIAHYTQAGIVAELKRLAVPASVDSIPSSGMQEDHVSMGWHAGRKLRRTIDGLTRVIAIETMIAGRALECRAPHQPAPATGAVLAKIRERVPGIGPDRIVAPEIEATFQLVAQGATVVAAESSTGPLA